MPTEETPNLPPLVRTVANTTISDTLHATCPPEEDCPQGSAQVLLLDGTNAAITSRPEGRESPHIEEQAVSGAAELPDVSVSVQQEHENPNIVSSGESSGQSIAERYEKQLADRHTTPLPVSSTALFPPLDRGLDHGGMPSISQHTSSFLKHGSKFVGTQHSGHQVYNVSVELKYVDMRESFLCGYLRIEGLTAAHPTLTTYFEGEIIGNKYTFQTRHDDWGSNIKVDMQHWNRFPAWRPLARAAQHIDFSYRNYAEREHLFMRWKEYFLVPDHRVRSISGASFEGFYYICFNQVLGTVSGIYFHSKSEKFQQLELKHVHDWGVKTATDFA